MKVALVLTVKNEERILRDNLLYHKAMGCEKIFVYFDGTTDDGKASIADLDFVEISDSVSKEIFEEVDFLSKFTSQMEEHHTARQCLNTYDAKCKCAKEAIDWLISIDADELVVPNIETKTDLPSFFKTIPDEIVVVNFQVQEVLQHKMAYTHVFAEETLFKTTHKFTSRFENIRKRIYNPFEKKYIPFSYWYGQHLGKAALRVDSKIIPHNVHRYKTFDGSAFKQIEKGFVLHYHAYDFEDFVKKFTNFKKHPDTFLSGNKVESIKLLLRDVVNHPDATNESLRSYFAENLLFSEKEVRKLLKNNFLYFFKRSTPALVKIVVVQEVFTNLRK
ncbi:MAG: glycosyltransferase family 2 protein [Flavobacteriaceae bacterium]|nr:glycosyltransferase family 2 protein [Flavobacteriaceae bacterium]